MYRLDEEPFRGSSVEAEERSRDSLKLEYAGGVGAVMADVSRNGRVPKLSSVESAPFAVLEVSAVDVTGGEKSGDASVAFSGAIGVVGGGIADVAASFTAFIRFSLAVAQGRSGLAKELLA